MIMPLAAYFARNAYPVTPSDTVDLPRFGAIKCKGVAGDIVFQGDDGVTTTYPIDAGEVLNVDVRRVLSAGTTATILWCFPY